MIFYWTLAYFILCIWALVSLIVAIAKRHEEGMELFAIIVPMMFISFSSHVFSNGFLFEVFGK